MSNSVKFIIKTFILLVYLITQIIILGSHYVAIGECASRIYYYPLDRWDYILIISIGIIIYLLSIRFIRASFKDVSNVLSIAS